MTEKDVLKIFRDEGAFLEGHFLLSSGLHSAQYMQCARVLQKPAIAEKLCSQLAAKLQNIPVDAVVGPALGGILVAHELARALEVRSLFTERVDGAFTLRRGFALEKGERVLVVEDVVTTGKSTREVLDVVQSSGARTVGVAALVDRSGGESGFKEPFFSLLKINIETYAPEKCPLCREGRLAVTKPGSRNAPNK